MKDGWYRITGDGLWMPIEVRDGVVVKVVGMWMNLKGKTLDSVLNLVVTNDWKIERVEI